MNDGTPIIIKKKKVGGHGGHHGGSWKVAYADFVTAMMAFFMVMWIMGLSDQTKALIQGYFNDPLGFTKNEPRAKVNVVSWKTGPPKTVAGTGESQADTSSPIKQEEKEMKALEEQIKKAISGGGSDLAALLKNVEFKITDEGLRIELIEASGAVFFETGKDTIRPEARKLIAKIAPLFIQCGRKMKLQGHTDSRPYSNVGSYDNWDLSNDRAQSMRRLLKALGLPQDRIIEVAGFADTQLRVPENPYHNSNRRVTILLPFHATKGQEAFLPKDDLHQHIQGMFRRPVDVAPERPAIKDGE